MTFHAEPAVAVTSARSFHALLAVCVTDARTFHAEPVVALTDAATFHDEPAVAVTDVVLVAAFSAKATPMPPVATPFGFAPLVPVADPAVTTSYAMRCPALFCAVALPDASAISVMVPDRDDHGVTKAPEVLLREFSTTSR